MKPTVLITGTRKGIGYALANHFLSKGWIVAGCSRKAGNIQHPNYQHFELDVNDEPKVIHMIKSILKKTQRIDVLINNAGIARLNHLLTTPRKSVDEIFQTNFLGTFLFLRECGKAMCRQKAGRIINFSTVAVPLSLEGEAIYASSKAAVETLTRISAKELGPFNITVNAIGPSPIKTDLIKTIPKEKIEALIEKQSIKKFATFEDVINIIDFLIKPESHLITSQIIYLTGIHS